MTTPQKLGLLAALYLAQGLPYGFFTQALPVVLREAEVSLEWIGLSSLLALPWAFKALWAPLVDRVGTPRQWILSLQALAVAGVLVLSALDVGAAPLWLAGAVLFTNLVAATQDIATDGLAVRTLGHDERGWGNGIQVGGYRVGMILGGGALLVVYDQVGWTVAMIGLAALLALSSLPLWFSEAGSKKAPASGGFSFNWLGRSGVWPWIGVLFAFKFGDYVASSMIRPYLVDLAYDKTQIGTMMGVGGFVAGLIGALVGGALVARLGRIPALVGFGVAQAVGVGAYALATLHPSLDVLWAAVIAEHVLGGLATAALFTAMMDASRPDRAATDYTLQASLVVLASGLGSAASGFIAAELDYTATFALGATLALLGPLLAGTPWFTRILRDESARPS